MTGLNHATVSGAANGTGGTILTGATVLAIFGDYATHWTLLFSFLGLLVLTANFVVNKRRGDRAEAREIEAHRKKYGPIPDKIEGTPDEQARKDYPLD